MGRMEEVILHDTGKKLKKRGVFNIKYNITMMEEEDGWELMDATPPTTSKELDPRSSKYC